MDFTPTREQRLLRDEIVAFARAELQFGAAERDRAQEFPHELWLKCGTLRLQGLMVPEEYGGRGLDPVSAAMALEALGYGCADGGLSFAIAAHMLACVVPVWKHGTEQQKQDYLPRMSDGSLIAGNAMTEAASGSDAFALATRAVRAGDVYRISGSKNFVSNGPVADVFVTYAATDPGKGYHGGVSAFVVPRDTPGVRLGQTFEKLGLRSCPIGEVVFDDAEVPVDALLGREGAGSVVFAQSMEWERILLAAVHIGTMERLLEQTITHARSRKQKGQSTPQSVSHRVADMKVRVDAARLLTHRAASRLDHARDISLDAAIAKLFVSEALVATAQHAVTTFGSDGIFTENEAERALRDAVAGTLYSGTSEIQRNIIARWLGL